MDVISATPRGIREFRERAGVSQGKLAAKTGLSVSTITRYERGVANLSVPNLQRIAAALGIKLMLPALDIEQSVTHG